jgi:uncharacterized protein (DUF3084 family)
MTTLKQLVREENRISKKIMDIRRSLRRKKTPTDSLNRIIQKRENALKKYNESVRTKNKTEILQTQKILMDIVREEIVATQIEELKSLEKKRDRIERDKQMLMRTTYWDFSD